MRGAGSHGSEHSVQSRVLQRAWGENFGNCRSSGSGAQGFLILLRLVALMQGAESGPLAATASRPGSGPSSPSRSRLVRNST